MAGKKAPGENSKKALGQARKAEAAAGKKAAQDRELAAVEDKEWSKGSKDNSKKEAAAQKAAEAARKKAEIAALAAAEEASLPSKPKGAGAKKAGDRKASTPAIRRGLDLSQLDDAASPSGPAQSTAASALNASGIDNALDALTLTTASSDAAASIDRHPERRFKAAYAAFEERRLEEMKDEKGLRRNQKIELIRKEFERHPDNPFNQVAGQFNSTREELRELGASERRKVEERLAQSP